MILTLGAHTIDIGPAQDPRPESVKFIQASVRTASGIKHVENYTVHSTTDTYNFANMPEDKYFLLKEFFVDYAVGGLYSFQIIDDLNVQKTVTFVSPEINFSRDFTGTDNNGFYSGKFSVEEAL